MIQLVIFLNRISKKCIHSLFTRVLSQVCYFAFLLTLLFYINSAKICIEEGKTCTLHLNLINVDKQKEWIESIENIYNNMNRLSTHFLKFVLVKSQFDILLEFFLQTERKYFIIIVFVISKISNAFCFTSSSVF